jgi:hypothetical protein
MQHQDKYIPITKWTIAKGVKEVDALSLLIPSYDRTWTYPRQIRAIWDKSYDEDKGTSWENEVCDKLLFLGIKPPVKYATCTDGEELFTEEEDIIVHTCWNFIFETKEEADNAFRSIINTHKALLERTIASEHEMILQAKQALAY